MALAPLDLPNGGDEREPSKRRPVAINDFPVIHAHLAANNIEPIQNERRRSEVLPSKQIENASSPGRDDV